MELTGQPGKCPVTFTLCTVTGRAWRNLGVRHSLLIECLSRGHELLWSTTQRFCIQILKIRCQSRDHRRVQDVRDVKHNWVCPPALIEGPQLIFKIFGLLPRESRHRKRSTKTLPRQSVRGFAICYFSLQLLLRNGDWTRFFRATRRRESNCENCRGHQGLQGNDSHAPPSDII